MGDLHVNGTVFGEDRPYSSSPPSPPLPVMNTDPSSVAEEAWSAAEKTTSEILRRIQPTLAADRRRREVVHYVQRLIRCGARCEVFPYGSVPLKTYLPDGDIDLTALSWQNIEDGLVSDVHAVLRGEENNDAAEYEVKDVRFIDAEVKLVKCLVQNIVVDISFNQLGGLSTLCFLEKVDRLVAKDHLFKRSIILIKAWCYYESRILGAHHGLISTYALETLVLYIFHQFHAFLDGPIAVLYRFLDYFSKFDWDNYCVSLKGPVGKSSLPDVVAEAPENGGNTLLTEEFIRSCVESFSVPPRGLDLNLRAFPHKHLNIIDPLKENNNLGRSVNRGNFYRIRSAFKYGARKLGWILMLPEDKIADELNRFFANTLDRHGSCQGNQHNYDIRNESERHVVKDVSPLAGPSFGEDSQNVATSGVLGIASTNGLSYCSNGKVENGICSETAVNSVIDDERVKHSNVSNSLGSHNDENNMASYGSEVLKDAANGLENNSFHSDRYHTSVFWGTEASKSLLDLAGDYDSHIANLQFGQMCNGYPVSPVMGPSPPSSPKLQNRSPWETVRQCLQVNHGIHSQTNSNCVVGPVYLVNHPTIPMTSFGAEEKRKPRGTGAYFPNMISRPFRENRPMLGRGRGQALGVHGSLQRYTRNNGLALAPHELNLSVEGSFEPSLEGYPSLGSAKARSTETYFSQPSTWGSRHANGFLHSSEKHESGSGPVSPQLHGPPRTEVSNHPQLHGPPRTEVSNHPRLHGPPRTEVSNHPDPGNSSPRGSVPNMGIVAEERSNSFSVADAKSSVFGGVHGHSKLP